MADIHGRATLKCDDGGQTGYLKQFGIDVRAAANQENHHG